ETSKKVTTQTSDTPVNIEVTQSRIIPVQETFDNNYDGQSVLDSSILEANERAIHDVVSEPDTSLEPEDIRIQALNNMFDICSWIAHRPN
ncbi:10224_t:CDS:2, partial [Paraglomus occultum]